MAHIYKNTPGFSNAPVGLDDAEDSDKKPAAAATSKSPPVSLVEGDRAQGNASIVPRIDIKSGTELGTILSVSGSRRQPKPHQPGDAVAAKPNEHNRDEVIDSKIPARAAREQERRYDENVIEEAKQENESSEEESSYASAHDNVARRVPSDDEASASSASTVSLLPLRAAPLLPPTLLNPVNAPRPLLALGLSQERMAQIMMLSFMHGEMQGMVRRGEIESTSNNADVAAYEYIEKRLNYDEEFDGTVDQVNDSLSMEHFTVAPKARPYQVADLTTAMASLNITGYPTMSEEEAEIERASSTDAEKASALSDLYGKFYSAETHQSKKSRRDLDERSIDFLVMQMRIEVDLLPVDSKQALLEAMVKCHPEEFSNARLFLFLRSEGMNTKLAAIRFANYWEARRELFGPDKCHLRMTLGEALRDDIVALEAGVCTILPYPDLSGRPLFFFEAARNTYEGYTPQSLMRAFWYIIEVLVRENKDPDGIFVRILMEKHDSLHHFDRFSVRRAYHYWMHCWPVSNLPRHQCCSSLFMRKVGRPVSNAVMDKASRARVLIHDVPDSELLGTLSKYGITASMLPTNMGGLVDLDVWLPRFIEQRRAIEMEEIA